MTEDEEFEFRARAEQEARAASAQPGPQPIENVAAQAGMAAAPAATELGVAGTKALMNAPVTALTNPLTHPISTLRNVAGAIERVVPQVPTQLAGPANSLVQSMPGTRAINVGEALVGGARGIGSALAAPESSFLMPYNMAAYEQAKIRENPNAPGLQYNPYAQQVRGEASTQNRAGAANQMRATANMPYGNVSPEERAMLNADMIMKQNIRKKAYEKVMGPVAPGQF